MLKTRMSSKGQVTLPKAVRQQMHLAEGAELAVSIQDDTIQLQRIVPRWQRWRGALSGTGLLHELEREHREEVERDESRLRRR